MAYAYPTDLTDSSTDRYEHVIQRVNHLKASNDQQRVEQWRMRTILDGGTEGVQALLGAKASDFDIDELSLLPIPDLLGSGLARFAHRLGRMPTTKVEPPQHLDTEAARNKADRVERIVRSYDHANRLEMMLPQIGRWVPGYGYAAIVVKTRYVDAEGRTATPRDYVYCYPHAELRDPYSTMPGGWGWDQQPGECAFLTVVKHKDLAELYPDHAGQILNSTVAESAGDWESRGWANRDGSGLTVVEYRDLEGTWVCVPEKRLVLDHTPNILTRPTFVLIKAFHFNVLKGHFDRAVGLMSGMAALNLLAQAAAEDEVFAETNLEGDVPESFNYTRGRGSYNILPPGVTAKRVSPQYSFQVTQQVALLERQFRQTTRYSQQADGDSPTSFATGRGLEELATGMEAEVREYQTAMRWGLQALDALMLEYDERLCDQPKPLVGWKHGEPFAETYLPSKDIKGAYRTKRAYGAMSTLEEHAQIAALLNLNQAGMFPRREVLQQMDGVDNPDKLLKAVLSEDAQKLLLGALGQKAMEGDPAAVNALIDMLEAGDVKTLLTTYFTPKEPQLSPEMAEFLNPPQPAPVPGAGLPIRPAGIQTTLARANGPGGKLGAQVVGTIA